MIESTETIVGPLPDGHFVPIQHRAEKDDHREDAPHFRIVNGRRKSSTEMKIRTCGMSRESVCNKRFLFRDFSIFANSFSVPIVGMIREAAFFFIDFLVSSNQYRAAILANRRRRFSGFRKYFAEKYNSRDSIFS